MTVDYIAELRRLRGEERAAKHRLDEIRALRDAYILAASMNDGHSRREVSRACGVTEGRVQQIVQAARDRGERL